MSEQRDLPLPAPPASGAVIINACCVLRCEGDHRVVVVSGVPVHHYKADDAIAAAYATVLLVDAGYATQKEVARAFGCSERTVRRHQERYADGGMAALAVRPGWRSGRRRLPNKQVRLIERMKSQGLSNREIARRLKRTEKAIREQVGPSRTGDAEQTMLVLDPNPPPPPEPASPISPPAAAMASALEGQRQDGAPHEEEPPVCRASAEVDDEGDAVRSSLDIDPADRTWDRLLAWIPTTAK